jgi:hypothetical protein
MLRRVGVVPAQYQLLVDLFQSLGERKELVGSLGLDRHAMRLTSLMLLLPGALFALSAIGPASLASFNLTVLALSSFVLLLLVVMEAANSFFNPAEVAVLAHQPIGSATYLAAKSSYLVAVVLRAELALNGPAALAGLLKDEARWFYPLTHLTAAAGAGIFVALATCAAFGVLFRFVPASRVRSAALWVQILVVTSPMLWDLAGRRVREAGLLAAWQANGWDWSFVPLTWFNAIAMAGQAEPAVPLGWGALVGALVSALLIAYGVASLSAGYMTRISGVLRSARRRRGRRRRSPLGGRVTRLLTGTPAGRAAWHFVHPMMRRDWQFRRAAVQLLMLFVLAGPAVILSARRASPFGDRRPAFIGILPELLSLLTLGLVQLLPYSDHYRARWVFALAPARERYVRGIYWSFWLPFVAVPFAAVAIGYAGYWGVRDAALFAVYGLAVSSLLLAAQLFFVEGLPFGSPPRAERAYTLLPFVLFGPVVIGITWVLQAHVLFRSRWRTLAATMVVGALAVLTARLTLRILSDRVRSELAPQPGAPGLFARTSESLERLR